MKVTTPEERKRAWEETPVPRPNWKSWKRLLQSCDMDVRLARLKWRKLMFKRLHIADEEL